MIRLTTIGLALLCFQGLEPIRTGYGAPGPYTMDTLEVENPHWKNQPILVFTPRGAAGKRPTIFFSHAFGGSTWSDGYSELMPHLVSRGHVVVYAPYMTLAPSVEERYEMLWDGFLAAVAKHGALMDMTRVGFVGHSFGGGATPALAYKGFVEKGWGENGRFLFVMAPWYSYRISQEQLQKFPPDTRAIIQVYEEDKINDHRMAIDLFENIGLPEKNKSFQLVRSPQGSMVNADHSLPGRNPSLELKSWGVFRPLDALADFLFHSNADAEKIAMGEREDRVVLRLFEPKPTQSESHYQFPWSNEEKNLRIPYGKHADPASKSRGRLRDRLRGKD